VDYAIWSVIQQHVYVPIVYVAFRSPLSLEVVEKPNNAKVL